MIFALFCADSGFVLRRLRLGDEAGIALRTKNIYTEGRKGHKEEKCRGGRGNTERPDFSVTFAAFCALPSSSFWRLRDKGQIRSCFLTDMDYFYRRDRDAFDKGFKGAESAAPCCRQEQADETFDAYARGIGASDFRYRTEQ